MALNSGRQGSLTSQSNAPPPLKPGSCGVRSLPARRSGCEWVREGSDAVLVNIWTGEVLSVASGVFW
jgi:hypothetical protein